jgi:three-Cys-motif partner protein
MKRLRYDEIGYWSEVKLDIIKKYAAAYSRILSSRTSPPLHHVYIDAFAGAGKHISRTTGEFVPGSPANALLITPCFREYHFIDLKETKVKALEELAAGRKDVFVHHGDCNRILIEDVLPRVRFEDYRRALCILDPYGLHLDWKVIHTIGQMRSIDMFLSFQVGDANRNVLWRNREAVPSKQLERMTAFWGDESWKDVAYSPSAQGNLFGEPDVEKATNEQIAQAFRKRLQEVAGFSHVPKPVAMRNTQNAIIYYLFFASHKPVAQNIVKDIFRQYEGRS